MSIIGTQVIGLFAKAIESVRLLSLSSLPILWKAQGGETGELCFSRSDGDEHSPDNQAEFIHILEDSLPP